MDQSFWWNEPLPPLQYDDSRDTTKGASLHEDKQEDKKGIKLQLVIMEELDTVNRRLGIHTM